MKPTVVAIVESETQKLYFEDVDKQFRLLFYLTDPIHSLHEQVREVLQIIKQSPQKVSGVFGVTDEPAIIASIVSHKLKLPSPSLKSIYRAQNKAILSQILSDINPHQQQTITITSPNQRIPKMKYPVFMKPAKGSLSMYSFKIDDEIQLRSRLNQVFAIKRVLIHWSKAFYDSQAKKGDPSIISFVIQPFINFSQYVLDGFVFDHDVQFLGITKSIYTPDRQSFTRFDYPTRISKASFQELEGLVEKLVKKLEFNNSGFNLEFFINPDGHILFIEFNTRLSIQFVPLMKQYYNESNLAYMAQIACGIKPKLTLWPDPMAASSCVQRLYEDKLVKKVPTKKEIEDLIKRRYVVFVRLLCEPGKRLSEYEQDSYTYRYALIDIAGKDVPVIEKKLKYAKSHLTFEFE